MGALSNSPRKQTVLTLEARKSFAFGVQFYDPVGERLDLTGATIRFVMSRPKHRGGNILVDSAASILDAELGLTHVNLQAGDLELAEDEYPFSLTLISALGYSTLILKGVIDIRENTDLESATATYEPTNPSTNLAAYMDAGNLIEVRVSQVDGMYVIISEMVADYLAQFMSLRDEVLGYRNEILSLYDLMLEISGLTGEDAAVSWLINNVTLTRAAVKNYLQYENYFPGVTRAPSAVLERFAFPEQRVAVFRDDVGSTKGLWLARWIGGPFWDCYELRETTSGPSGHLTTQLRKNEIRLAGATFETDGTSAEVVKTGAWTTVTSGSANNGSVVYSTSPATNIVFTPPSGVDSSILTMRAPKGSNGGYSKIDIDGDRTRAIKLTTAQQEVDAGRLPSSALTTNGGTLEPDQKVYNHYQSGALTYINYVTLVDDLSVSEPGVVTFTPTGYKQAASTAARAYIDTFSTGYEATAAEFAAGPKPLVKALFNQSSVWEGAIRPELGTIPGWDGWLLNSHGYDQDDTVSVLVDGVAHTLLNGEAVAGTHVQLRRTSTVLHPGTLVPIGNVVMSYMPTRFGLMVSGALEPLIDFVMDDASYLAMWPRNLSFTRNRNVALVAPETAGAGDSSFKSNARGDALIAWEPDSEWGSMFYIPDVENTARSFPSEITQLAYQDRADFCKGYASITNTDAPWTWPAGSIVRWSMTYSTMKFGTSAELSLADL